MAARDLAVRILVSLRDNASEALTGIAGAAAKTFAVIGTLATGLGALFSAKIFGDAVTEAKDLETQLLQLEAVVQATGGAAGYSVAQIDQLARSMGDAAEVRAAAAQLLTFKSIAGETFERTLTLAKDLSASGFGTLESATVQLGKALENPAQGLSALAEVGVTFTEGQKALVASLVLTGDQAKAQGVILDAVAGQVGGVAENMDRGLEGALENIRDTVTELLQQLGASVVPVFTEFARKVNDLYTRLRDSGAVKAFGDALASAFQVALTWAGKFLEDVNFETALAAVNAFADGAKEKLTAFGETMANIGSGVKTTMDVLSVAWNAGAVVIRAGATAIAGALALVGEAQATLYGMLAKVGIVSQETADSMASAAEAMRASAEENYDKTGEAVAGVVDGLKSLAGEAPVAAQAQDGLADATRKTAEAAKVAASAQTLQASATGKAKAAAAEAKAEIADLQAKYRELMVAGDVQKAAGILSQIEKIKTGLAQTANQAEGTAARVAGAFKSLGVQSQGDLALLAANAMQQFEIIRASGTATPLDIQNAFIAAATQAIAANNGIADSTLKVTAEQLGLEVQTTETGDKIVQKGQEVTGSNEEVSGSYEGVGQSADDMGQSVEETSGSVDQLTEAQESSGGAAQAMRLLVEQTIGALREYSDAAATAVDTIINSLGTWQDKVGQIRELNASDFIDTTGVNEAKADLAELEAAAASAHQQAEQMRDSMTKAFDWWGPFYDGLSAIKELEAELADAAVAAKRTEIAIDAMESKLSDLTDSFDDGSMGAADYLAQLERLRLTYAALSDEDLASLDDEIRSVQDSMKDQADSAADSLDDWREKLAGIRDQEVEIQKLQWQQALAENQVALAEARRNGNAEEITALEQKIGLINEYYQAQVDAAAEQEAQNAIDAAEEVAAEAERIAGLSAEERLYEETLASLKAQLAAAIKANDSALKASVLAQIEAEKQRHALAMANADAETAAKEDAANAESATTTSSSGSAARSTSATASSTSSTSSTRSGGSGNTYHINIEGVLDVNDRSTLDSLARKLRPVLAELDRKGA